MTTEQKALVLAELAKVLKRFSRKVSNDIIGCDDADGVGYVFELIEDMNIRAELQREVMP